MDINRRDAITLGVGALSSTMLNASQKQPRKKAKRILFICNSLGFVHNKFYPTETGAKARLPDHFEKFEPIKDQFTVFTGVEHPGLQGTLHASEMCFLTSEKNASNPAFVNSISIDQLLKQQIGHHTRYASLNLSLDEESICYTESGVMIPPMYDDVALYKSLFTEKTALEKKQIKDQLQRNKLRIDVLEKESLKSKKEIGLENFYKNLAILKANLKRDEKWLNTAPPKVNEKLPYPTPQNADLMERMNNFLTCIRLAFQTDQTRVAVLHFPFYNRVPNIKGVDTSWHRLTHSKKTPGNLKQLILIEKLFMDNFAAFLQDMAKTKMADGSSLLDETIVLMGSNLGEHNAHDTRNLPVVVAGGGFNHGGHIRGNADPLNELFLSLVRNLDGVTMPSFKGVKKSFKAFS